MRNEIAEEDLLDDIEFEPATEEQAIKASLQDSIDELTAMVNNVEKNVNNYAVFKY